MKRSELQHPRSLTTVINDLIIDCIWHTIYPDTQEDHSMKMKMVTVEVNILVEDDYDTSTLDELITGALDIISDVEDVPEMDGVVQYSATVLSEREHSGR